MIDSSICVNIVLGGIAGSIFLTGIFGPVRELSDCHYCNKLYFFYVRSVCTAAVLMLISNSLNTSRLFDVGKMIRRIEEGRPKTNWSTCIAYLSAKVMLVILRTYAELQMGPLTILITDHLPFLCVYALGYRFIMSLSVIRRINLTLLEKMEAERARRKESWAMDTGGKDLGPYLIRASEVREVYQAVNDVFGFEFFLMQLVIVCGLAVHGFFLVHFTLHDEFSLSRVTFFCAALIECSVLSYFFARIGQSTADAAKDVIAEISNFPIAFCERNSFDGVNYIILLSVKEPWNQNAWTFYGLTMDSFFSTVSATAAFMFVCLQFGSGHSVYEFSIF